GTPAPGDPVVPGVSLPVGALPVGVSAGLPGGEPDVPGVPDAAGVVLAAGGVLGAVVGLVPVHAATNISVASATGQRRVRNIMRVHPPLLRLAALKLPRVSLLVDLGGSPPAK